MNDVFNKLYLFWRDWRDWVYTDVIAYCFVCMLGGLFLTLTIVYAKDLYDSLRAKKR